jgi:hypothetical protein
MGGMDFAAYSLGGYWTHFGPAGTSMPSSRARFTTSTVPPIGLADIQGIAASIEGISFQGPRWILHRTAGATGLPEHRRTNYVNSRACGHRGAGAHDNGTELTSMAILRWSQQTRRSMWISSIM